MTTVSSLMRAESRLAAASMPASTAGSSSNRVKAWNRSRLQRVEADRDAMQSRGSQRGRMAAQQHAVGRHRQIAHRGRARQPLDERRQVAAEQRLAAGEPDAIDPERR